MTAPEHTLVKRLDSNGRKLRRHQLREKFRASVHALIAIKRMAKLYVLDPGPPRTPHPYTPMSPGIAPSPKESTAVWCLSSIPSTRSRLISSVPSTAPTAPTVPTAVSSVGSIGSVGGAARRDRAVEERKSLDISARAAFGRRSGEVPSASRSTTAHLALAAPVVDEAANNPPAPPRQVGYMSKLRQSHPKRWETAYFVLECGVLKQYAHARGDASGEGEGEPTHLISLRQCELLDPGRHVLAIVLSEDQTDNAPSTTGAEEVVFEIDDTAGFVVWRASIIHHIEYMATI